MVIEIFPELTAKLAGPYRAAFQAMLEQSDEAVAQCDRGNVETAFRLLREDRTIEVPNECTLNKERVLDAAWLALPAMYQAGDIDPD